MDEDADINKVRRYSGIDQENRQKTRVLTHSYQGDLRAQIRDEMRQKSKKKAADEMAILERRLVVNNEYELKMSRIMCKEDICEDAIKNINHKTIIK